MKDFRDLKMFIRDGRKHVEEWIRFVMGHSQLMVLVPIFQPDLSLEENCRNLRDAGKIDQEGWDKNLRFRWHQKAYLYSGDDGLLVLFALEKNRWAFLNYVESLVKKYKQKGYILWDGNKSVLLSSEGRNELPAFTGSLDSLDELAGFLVPGFRTTGEFDRDISYVRMRDYQTRPKPNQDQS